MSAENLEIKQIKPPKCLDCGCLNCMLKAMFEGAHNGNHYVVLFAECTKCGKNNKVLFSDSDGTLENWSDIFALAKKTAEESGK